MRVVKVLGMVNCVAGFGESPGVINGCSDLLVEVFGSAVGSHARSAVGIFELPFNIAVEIEMTVRSNEALALDPALVAAYLFDVTDAKTGAVCNVRMSPPAS